jgi:hypothetical protein
MIPSLAAQATVNAIPGSSSPDAQLTTAATRAGADKTVGRKDRPRQPRCSRVNRRASRGC